MVRLQDLVWLERDGWGRQFLPLELAPGEPARWYRLMLFDRPVAPWRPGMAQVTQDAIELGHASTSKRYRGRVFLTVPAWVAWIDLANGRLGKI